MDEPTDALTDTAKQSLFRVIPRTEVAGTVSSIYPPYERDLRDLRRRDGLLRTGSFIAEARVSSLDEDRLIEMMVWPHKLEVNIHHHP